MRTERSTQAWLDYQVSALKVTNEYFARYEAVSKTLDAAPGLLKLVHRDLRKALKSEGKRHRKGSFRFTSENVLRLVLCMTIEGLSLREVVVRVDDSNFLRRFARIYDGPMMNFTTLCRLRNAIRPQTWKKMNQVLAKAAVDGGLVTGEELRLDTTAVETNIHWPTDSTLLWDCYRTLARLIDAARQLDPGAVGTRRLHLRAVKRISTRISRKAQRKGRKASDLSTLYKRLIRAVEGICDWAPDVVIGIERGLKANRYGVLGSAFAASLISDLRHFEPLSRQVIWQATERVLNGRQVANEDKLFSIFEEHTELLKRGKAGKDVEFGHMIQIQQVGGKFITDYEVFEKKPSEASLVAPALKSHEKLFGHAPDKVSADMGYWPGNDHVEELIKKVGVFSVPKKGGLSIEDRERQLDPLFRLAQRFRAGVEGSISFLKRILRLVRCMNKGWDHFVSTIGTTILAHNLLVLAR